MSSHDYAGIEDLLFATLEAVSASVKAALALALWDGVDVPQDVRDVIDRMGGQVEESDAVQTAIDAKLAEGRNE